MSKNLAAIDKILATETLVEVGGITLALTVPGEEDIREIRGLASRMAKEHEAGEVEAGMETFLELSTKATAACLGVDEGVALRLFSVSGGNNGELFSKVQDLLGMTPGEDEDEPPADPS